MGRLEDAVGKICRTRGAFSTIEFEQTDDITTGGTGKTAHFPPSQRSLRNGLGSNSSLLALLRAKDLDLALELLDLVLLDANLVTELLDLKTTNKERIAISSQQFYPSAK